MAEKKPESIAHQLGRSRNPRDRVRARVLARMGRRMEGQVVLEALRRLAKTDSPGAGVAAGMAAPNLDTHAPKGPMVGEDVYTPVPGERRRPPTTRRTPYITLPQRSLPHN